MQNKSLMSMTILIDVVASLISLSDFILTPPHFT